MLIRKIDPSEYGWAQKLNSSAVPFVNHLDIGDFQALVRQSFYARLCLSPNHEPIGLLIGFLPGADYQSANYHWINARYDDFFYIDRIVVHGNQRGQGVARRLYADAAIFARDHGMVALMCEVNSKPANTVSLLAHAKLGFEPVGRQTDPINAEKEVTFLRKALTR